MNSNKRLYLGLSMASLMAIGLAYIIIYNLVRFQDYPVFRGISIGLSTVFIILFVLVAAGLAAMVITIMRAQKIPSLEGSIRFDDDRSFRNPYLRSS